MLQKKIDPAPASPIEEPHDNTKIRAALEKATEALQRKPMPEDAVILYRAAHLIEEYGLTKRVLQTPADGCLCIRGAMLAAQGYSLPFSYPDTAYGEYGKPQLDRRSDYWSHMTDVLEPKYIDPILCESKHYNGKSWEWNNHSSTKKQDVVDALRRAGDLACEEAE